MNKLVSTVWGLSGLMGGLISLVIALPARAETVIFGVRWTDNRGNFEIQNRFDRSVFNLVVTYQRLGRNAQNNLTRRVCEVLSPKEVCRFGLPWSADSPVNITDIRGQLLPRGADLTPPRRTETVNPFAPRSLSLAIQSADNRGNFRINNDTGETWSNVTVSYTRIDRTGGLSMTNRSLVVCSRVVPGGVCQFQIRANRQGESIRINRVTATAFTEL